MAIKIGHAVNDENGKSTGGTAGDQTGKEVKTQAWYNRSKGWSAVFRAKDSAVAEKIAKAMEQACANDKIGYDQNQRTTLYAKAKEKNWNLSKITSNCECDCSALVAVCVNAAGIKVSKDMVTANEKAVLSATGKFDVLTDSKYLTSDKHLKRGDILLGTGHTAVVLTNGEAFTEKNGDYTMEMRILKKGCKGKDVKSLQILLRGMGYNGSMGTPDGIFGSNTEGAVKLYQKAKNLKQDGIAGEQTMKSLWGVD